MNGHGIVEVVKRADMQPAMHLAPGRNVGYAAYWTARCRCGGEFTEEGKAGAEAALSVHLAGLGALGEARSAARRRPYRPEEDEARSSFLVGIQKRRSA